MEHKNTIEIVKDRFVTPTLSFLGKHGFGKYSGYDAVSVGFPGTLDNATAIILDVSPRAHRFNYPATDPDYPATDYTGQGILLEWDFDDADGSTITDRANGVILTEQGDPTFQQSAAVPGLGKGVTLDGTGDAFDILVGSIADGLLPTTGNFSVEAVCNLTSGSGGAGDTIACCRTGAAGVGWQLQLDANEHLDVHIEDAGGQTAQEGDADICTDVPVYICSSFDRKGNLVTKVKTLSTGVDIDSTTTDISSRTGTVRPVAGASNRFAIGGDAARTAGDCLTGTMYYSRLYNKALTAAEMADNAKVLGYVLGGPGWEPLFDPADGHDLTICKSGSNPGRFDHTEYMTLNSMAFRAHCVVEQSTTPSALDFYWVFK